jgi:ribose 1,5-bisphosphokinase PhnN
MVGPRMALDAVNPRTLELEVAKEILAELFDIRTHEADEMIRQRMEERTMSTSNHVHIYIISDNRGLLLTCIRREISKISAHFYSLDNQISLIPPLFRYCSIATAESK